MNCHGTVKKDSDVLLPIRAAYAENEPVRWTRVHDLPDYVYFNHMAHVNATIGCETCHGRIDQMVKVYQAKPLTMEWCINCHKDPTPYLRKSENLTKMGYDDETSTPHRQAGEGEDVQRRNTVHPPTHCSTCHR
jgi:hypothetical protein